MYIPPVNLALRRRSFEEGKVYHEVSFYEQVGIDLDEDEYYHPDNIDYINLVMCIKCDWPITFLEFDTGKVYEYDDSYCYYEMDKRLTNV